MVVGEEGENGTRYQWNETWHMVTQNKGRKVRFGRFAWRDQISLRLLFSLPLLLVSLSLLWRPASVASYIYFLYLVYFYYDCYLLLSDVELNLKQGVYLFLGYSQKDEALLKKVTNQGAVDAIGAIQGLVSYHNVNSNKVRTKTSINASSILAFLCSSVPSS